MSFRLAKYTLVPKAYAMTESGAPDGIEKPCRNGIQEMHFVFGAPKNAKTFQLSLIYFRADLTRVEASRHSAERC